MRRISAAVLIAAMLALTAGAADEIAATVSFKVTKGYLDFTRAVNATWTITAASPNVAGQTQLIGLTPEQVTIGDVTTAGWSFFRNLNASNVIEIGAVDASTNFLPLIKLKAGEYALMRMGTNFWYAKAFTAASRLEKAIVDN